MARFRRKMTESGDFGQIIKEITDDHSKHVAKLRSDALEQREMKSWMNDLSEQDNERRAQERTQINSIFRINLKILFNQWLKLKKKFQTITTHRVLVFN